MAMVGLAALCVRVIPAAVVMLLFAHASAFGTCPQGPQTFEEATIFNVQCNDTDVVVWTAAESVRLSNLRVFNKSLTVYGYMITLDTINLVGTNLTVVAPFVDCGGVKNVTLSTTGVAAPVSYTPNVTEPLKCTSNGCQGSPGNSTTIGGGSGGNVAIYATETRNCDSTAIEVITVGGMAGRGEDGGDGIVGDNGSNGRGFDCDDCDSLGEVIHCEEPFPLLNYNGQQYDLLGRPEFCGAYFNPDSQSGQGQGGSASKGGLPGIAGNSTYSGSGGSVTLPAVISGKVLVDSSPGMPIAPLAVNGRPGAGGRGGQGGTGYQVYFEDNRLHCATIDARCQCPSGPDGPPGCEESSNSTNSCSTVVPQPQVVGTPPSAGQLSYNNDLATKLVQPQIDMVMTVASRFFFNRQYDDAVQAYLFLVNACNVTANLARIPKCATVVTQSIQKISQMANGFDFYGDPVTFTPLIGLSALENYAGTQLANFKELEIAYSTYWKASTSAADKEADLTNTIRKNTENIENLRRKQADVLTQQHASLAEFNVLAAKRSAAKSILNAASEDFKIAVNKARDNEPSFLELLGVIASTAVNVGADLAGIGGIIGSIDKLIPGDDKIRNRQVASGFSSTTYVIDGVENKIYPAWKGYAEHANAASEDATKITTDSKQFNDYLETYKDLPQAKQYKADLSAYQQICASASAKVLQNTAQFQQYEQLESQIKASNSNTEDIQGMLSGQSPNPAAVEFANYISGSYVLAQQSVLQSIYQINQAYRYAFPGAPSNVTIGSNDYQGLSTANAELLNNVKTELTLQGGNSHSVNGLPPYVINSTLPGFSDLLKPDGRFTFFISPDDPLFYNLAQFYASKVEVTVLGVVTALSANPRLDVNLRHLGTPAVVSTSCEKYTFSHNFRDSTYSYDVNDPSHVYSDGYLGGCGSGAPSDGKCSSTDDVYIGLSPFSYWEISFPGTFFDYSQITGVGLSFSGQSRTPDTNACFKSVANSLQQPLQLRHSFVQPAQGALLVNPSLQAQGSSHLALNGSLPAGRRCVALPNTNFSVTLDFGYLLQFFTNGLLMDNGNLRFPIPDLQARILVTAKSVLPELSGQASPSKFGLISSEIGSAPLEIDGSNAYTATFTVTQERLLAIAMLNPSFTGLYKIVLTPVSEDPEINDWLSELKSVLYDGLICNPLASANLP